MCSWQVAVPRWGPWAWPLIISEQVPQMPSRQSWSKQIGSALAAIVSPLVAGYVIDVTGNWYLPFLMSMGLLLLGGFCAFLMHPETPFEATDSIEPAGRSVAAG